MMLTADVESKYREDKENVFNALVNDKYYSSFSKEDKIFMNYVRNYYFQREMPPDNAIDLGVVLFYEAVGMITLKNSGILTNLTMATVDLNQRKNSRMGYDRPPGEGGWD